MPVAQELLGASEITANLYCKLRASVLGRFRDFQYVFAVIYETLCILHNLQ